jgi:hypothetical protein
MTVATFAFACTFTFGFGWRGIADCVLFCCFHWIIYEVKMFIWVEWFLYQYTLLFSILGINILKLFDRYIIFF